MTEPTVYIQNTDIEQCKVLLNMFQRALSFRGYSFTARLSATAEDVVLTLLHLSPEATFEVFEFFLLIATTNGVKARNIRCYWYCSTLKGIQIHHTAKKHWWMVTTKDALTRVVTDCGDLYEEDVTAEKRITDGTCHVLRFVSQHEVFLVPPEASHNDAEITIVPGKQHWLSTLRLILLSLFHYRAGTFSVKNLLKITAAVLPLLSILPLIHTIIPLPAETCWCIGTGFIIIASLGFHYLRKRGVFPPATIPFSSFCYAVMTLFTIFHLIFTMNYITLGTPYQQKVIITRIESNHSYRHSHAERTYYFRLPDGLSYHYTPNHDNDLANVQVHETRTLTVAKGVWGLEYIKSLD